MVYSLSIYKISINARWKKDEKQILSDFDNGKDLLNLTDEFFANWLNVDSQIQKDKTEKRVSRIGIEAETHHYYKNGRVIDGIIESGEFGQEMDVIDIDSGNSNYVIKPNDAPLKPFYFMFYIPEDETYGFLILQRIGRDGIFSHLINECTSHIKKSIKGDFSLKILPFCLPEILEKNLKLVDGARSIIIKDKNTDILKSIGLGILKTDGATGEIKYTLPRGKRFDINAWLRKVLKKDFEEEQMPVSTSDISLEVKTDSGSVKKISIGSINSFGTNWTLGEKIKLNSKGFPEFGTLRKEAYELLEYIKKSLGLDEKSN